MKRKICVFCETWESGGIESFLTNVLLRLDMNCFSVDLVAAELKDSVFTERLEKHGVLFRQLSGNIRNIRKNRSIFRALLSRQKYDVLHLNIYQGLSMCYAAEAKKAGVPVRIIHSHNTALRKSLGRPAKLAIHNFAKRYYASAGTRFLACSADAAKFMYPLSIIKDQSFSVVPNGISTKRFQFCEEERSRFRNQLGLQGKFVVGHIGRLCYQKNQSFLLEVFAELAKLRPDSKLLLIGNGEDEGALRQKAQRLGITDDVIFYGSTATPEKTLWAMDVFVFPSHFEGLGIVAIEAQASGLPVICSEAIPAEAFLTCTISRLALMAGASVWARSIAACKKANHREKAAAGVRQAGFDIEDVSTRMAAYYLEG